MRDTRTPTAKFHAYSLCGPYFFRALEKKVRSQLKALLLPPARPPELPGVTPEQDAVVSFSLSIGIQSVLLSAI